MRLPRVRFTVGQLLVAVAVVAANCGVLRLGPHTDLERTRLRKAVLTPGRTPEDSFNDIAGIYDLGDTVIGVWRFEISRDGRFTYFHRSCSSPYFQEYGYLKRHDGEIQLIQIPHPGKESRMTSKYRPIEWGGRMYLSTADDHELQRFCRAALMPKCVTDSVDVYGACLRVSDRKKPRTGLPRLPAKVWVRFLVDEMSLRNEEGSLRLALKSLIPRITFSERIQRR